MIRALHRWLLRAELWLLRRNLADAQDRYDLAVAIGNAQLSADAALFHARLRHHEVQLQRRLTRLSIAT